MLAANGIPNVGASRKFSKLIFKGASEYQELFTANMRVLGELGAGFVFHNRGRPGLFFPDAIKHESVDADGRRDYEFGCIKVGRSEQAEIGVDLHCAVR
jgi:hypothetical protein